MGPIQSSVNTVAGAIIAGSKGKQIHDKLIKGESQNINIKSEDANAKNNTQPKTNRLTSQMKKAQKVSEEYAEAIIQQKESYNQRLTSLKQSSSTSVADIVNLNKENIKEQKEIKKDFKTKLKSLSEDK